MIGIDSSVLVRYFAMDDAKQSPVAARLIDSLTPEEPGFVSVVTLVETLWVLRRSYRTSAESLVEIARGLTQSETIEVQHADAVRRAIAAAPTGYDLPDALIAILGVQAGCSKTVTFDRNAGNIPGMEVLGA
jgi:predicted nucleic-acid-binding protein